MSPDHSNLFKLFDKYKSETWYLPILNHVTTRYGEIESNLQGTFQMVTPDTSNRYTHSPVFSRIIKDIASTFGSALKEFVQSSGESYSDDICGYLKLIREYVPDIQNRSALFRFNEKTLLPFKRSNKDDPIPAWWNASNKLKHKEITYYREGNLENALNGVAALAIIGKIISHSVFVSTNLFANLGIAYAMDAIDVSKDRLLFP